MTKVKIIALAAALASMSLPTYAADRGDDISSSDYNWIQFKAMYAFDELPSDGASGHNYLEMEFGGRAGFVDLYGYVDVFNLATVDSGDKAIGTDKSKMFMKFSPRFSIDAITGWDLSSGPILEVYFSTLFNWGGGVIGEDVNASFWGIGADVMIPWLGKTGMNLYANFDMNSKKWNGYQFSVNWFKPFYNFNNGSFVSFQGYVDYQFGADDEYGNEFVPMTSNGGAASLGIQWHSDNYALGYALKLYKDVYLLENGAGSVGLKTTGLAQYLSSTYKF